MKLHASIEITQPHLCDFHCLLAEDISLHIYMKKAQASNAFIQSVLSEEGPQQVVDDSEPEFALYHTASVVHKFPGRHASSSVALLQPLISRKRELVQFQENLFSSSPAISPAKSLNQDFFQSKSFKNIRKVPISKADGELLIFKEVFVQPRRDILDQVKTQLSLHREEVLKRNPRLNALLTRSQSLPPTVTHRQSPVKREKSYLNQQIQVQPPEGLNASVAAPLTPGGGWAPSIPAGSGFARANLKDMTMRATAGVQSGDVQKEAHMAYCLGALNEQKGSYKEAGKFYKRFFFCARMLDDPIGAALGLNRLGVIYFNQHKYQKSLQFHQKHCEFTDIDNKFAAFYNIGLCLRALDQYAESLHSLTQAFQWAEERQDQESQCIALGQLGATALACLQKQEAYNYFKASLELGTRLRNERLRLDALLALGFLAYQLHEEQASTAYFATCLSVLFPQVCKSLQEPTICEQSQCNIGISLGKFHFPSLQASLLESIG